MKPNESLYYSSNWLHNFKGILGDTYIEWFIPTFKPTRLNNGYEYEYNRTKENLPLKTMDTDEMKNSRHSYIGINEGFNTSVLTKNCSIEKSEKRNETGADVIARSSDEENIE